MTERRRPAWLTVAPEPEQLIEHRAVCGVDGEPFPCRHVRNERARLRQQQYLDSLCWWCGNVAKSRFGYTAILPDGTRRHAAWCGPAKHRRCHVIGQLHYERNRHIWTVPPPEPGQLI